MQRLQQLTFASLQCDRKKRKTRREIFLERMDSLIPWERLEARIAPVYPKGGRRGRQPYPLSVMLRVHCVQLFYNLSDPLMEDQLYEAESIRRFAGVSLEKVPDETTIPSSAIGWSATDWRTFCSGDQGSPGRAGGFAEEGHHR